MRNEKLKIGVFDSGLGGLTVVQALKQVIKNAELFYIADTKHAPYGEKTQEQILQYSLDIAQYFIEHHQIDALVVACNTATSAAIQKLRENYPKLIIIGTEPGIKPAIEQTKTGKIGVLATPATLKGDKYQVLARQHTSNKHFRLYEQPCHGLVEQIEQGEIDTAKTLHMLTRWLKPMKENDVDTIVLGCTHYPLVSKIIQKVMHKEILLIHTGEAIARHLLTLSAKIGHQNVGELDCYYYTTDILDKKMIQNVFNLKKPIERISV